QTVIGVGHDDVTDGSPRLQLAHLRLDECDRTVNQQPSVKHLDDGHHSPQLGPSDLSLHTPQVRLQALSRPVFPHFPLAEPGAHPWHDRTSRARIKIFGASPLTLAEHRGDSSPGGKMRIGPAYFGPLRRPTDAFGNGGIVDGTF